MTLSHELRTPLNAIARLGHRCCDRGARAGVAASARSRPIERNAQAQTRLVEDLLDVSRAISGKLQIERTAGESCRRRRWRRSRRCGRRSIAQGGSRSRRTSTATLGADRRPTRTGCSRSSGTCCRTPSSSRRAGGSFSCASDASSANVEIVVRDNGAGIAPGVPAVRLRPIPAGGCRPRREHGGLGLGLSIVRHLVELHGGTVTAESDGAGRGATFRVLLPTAPGQPVRATAKVTRSPAI